MNARVNERMHGHISVCSPGRLVGKKHVASVQGTSCSGRLTLPAGGALASCSTMQVAGSCCVPASSLWSEDSEAIVVRVDGPPCAAL